MDWDKLDKEITRSPRYKFFKKHERVMIFIQGIIVIGLMIGILMFFVQDREMKEQIRDRCGYTTDTYDCICEPNLVANWKEFQEKGYIDFNLSNLNITPPDNG